MDTFKAKVIGIRPMTNTETGKLFWNIGFRFAEPLMVATGVDENKKPIMESVDTFSLGCDDEFPEDTLGKWFEITGLSMRVAVDDENNVIRHSGVGMPCLNADAGFNVEFHRIEGGGIRFT